MHQPSWRLSTTTLALAAAQLVGIHSAVAADSEDKWQLEEIVVTARRTEENLQTTPISITAITQDEIAARGMSNIIDAASAAPSVNVTPGANYSGKSALTFIRGVGQDQFTYAFEPGVGFYVDDVYYGTVYGSIFELADIDNIQVLRGPQGTLFGKNNEGGAILLNTPIPKGDNSGEIKLGYGSYHREFVKASFDIPIGEKLALRLSGATNRQDGYVDRIDYACAHPGAAGTLQPMTSSPDCKLGTDGGTSVSSLRAALKWQASDNLTVLLRGELMDDHSEAGAQHVIVQNEPQPGSPNDLYNQFVTLPLYGIGAANPAFVTSPYQNYSTYRNPGTGTTLSPSNDLLFHTVSSTIDWDTAAGIHVKSIVAYQQYESKFTNTDPGPVPQYLQENHLDHHQFTAELQFGGKLFSDRLDWLAGAYYLRGEGRYSGHIELPVAMIVPPGTPGFPPYGAFGLNFNLNDPTHQQSKSVFAHAIYHFTDKFSGELGARYSIEKKTQGFDHTYTLSVPANVLFPPGSPAFPADAGGTSKINRIDPKLALQYQWTPDLMTYVQVSTGYKNGGINPKPAVVADIVTFRPEKLTAYELGMKSEWFDRRLMVNANIYQSNYKDIQISQFIPPPLGSGGTVVINAGKARIRGVEVDMQARVFRALSLTAGASYLDYKIKSLSAPPEQLNGLTTDADLPAYVPAFKGSVGAQYAINLNSSGTLTPRIDWNYQSKVYFDPANTPESAQAGYGTVNLRLGWDSPDNTWSTAIELRNATDKFYYLSKTPTLNVDGSVQNIFGTPTLPRTWFANMTRRF